MGSTQLSREGTATARAVTGPAKQRFTLKGRGFTLEVEQITQILTRLTFMPGTQTDVARPFELFTSRAVQPLFIAQQQQQINPGSRFRHSFRIAPISAHQRVELGSQRACANGKWRALYPANITRTTHACNERRKTGDSRYAPEGNR